MFELPIPHLNAFMFRGGGDITETKKSYYGVLLRFITVYYGLLRYLLRILRHLFHCKQEGNSETGKFLKINIPKKNLKPFFKTQNMMLII